MSGQGNLWIFFWVAHAGIRSQPKWKKKQLHLRKHTHTHRELRFSIWLPVGWDRYWGNPTQLSPRQPRQAVQLHYVQLNDFHSILLSAAPHTHTGTLGHTDWNLRNSEFCLSVSKKKKGACYSESIVKTCNTSDQVAYREQQTENRNKPKRHFQLALPLSDNLQASLLAHKTFAKPSRGTLPV